MPETGDPQPQAQNSAAMPLQASFEQALALHEQGRLAEAERIYRDVLQRQPNHFAALHQLGLIALQTRHTERAVELIGKAIALKPDFAQAYCDHGMALRKLKRFEDALASYDKAIALKPDFAMAYNNRGNVLLDLKRAVEALASCDKAIALNPRLAIAYYNRGNALQNLRRPTAALTSYDGAIALNPDLAEAWLGRGNVFFDVKRLDEALPAYDKATALKPDLAEGWLGRGNVFTLLKRYDEALVAYDRALRLSPDLTGLQGLRLQTKMHLCDWNNFDVNCANLLSSVRNGNVNTTPFAFLAIPSSSAEQLKCARLWVANRFPLSDSPVWQGERYDHDRIRIAYISPDFHEHPLPYLVAGLFECHDKSLFEVTAISIGPDDGSEMRRRLQAAFEHFVDAEKYDDDQVAQLIKERQIDILVDLAGLTSGSRTSVLAKRPAPIQVNYLGYPGTMGASFIDYIVSDRLVIPDGKQDLYAEKVVYLPESFMGNDGKRKLSERAPNRSECSLPETGFVFCSFNQSYKIVPEVFGIWMRLLRQFQNSVLWLSNTNDTAIRNLQREAQNRGVDPRRLVFAQRVPLNQDHLARHQLADLFLDTLPYNAHASASDALWAGLPVLTCLGETFAGRVAASLLNAIGLPELITTTSEAYERMAIDLATQPAKLAAIKRKLAENRLTKPLFNTRLFTGHLEAAYTAMYERHQAGLAPDHIVIPSGGGGATSRTR